MEQRRSSEANSSQLVGFSSFYETRWFITVKTLYYPTDAQIYNS